MYKKSELTDLENQQLQNSVKYGVSVDHPNFFKVYDYYESSEFYFIVKEHLPNFRLLREMIDTGYKFTHDEVR